TFDFQDNKNVEGDENVRLRYQDGSKTTSNNAVIYPTVQTSKGARLFFYEPVVIDLANWDGSGRHAANLTALKFPDGDGYTSITVAAQTLGGPTINGTFSVGGYLVNTTEMTGANSALSVKSAYISVGQLTYNITSSQQVPTATKNGENSTVVVQLMNVANATMSNPAVVLFEEKDDSTAKVYEALIVNVEGAGTTSASVGISDVETTWGRDAQFDEIQMKSATSIYKSSDFWGSIITTDQSDTDSYSATISYPDEQVYAKLYIAENSAAITAGGSAGGSGGSLGSVTVRDSEVASVSSKNLIVLGGSCINTVAATLLGNSSPLCGADFTTKTGVGSGEYLVETFASPQSASKIATLVAGYNAADTTNAVKFLTTKSPATDSGKKYKGTTATDGAVVV
ncbi:MAG: hypothetical protein AABW91_04660, partial [Nanoarchaeota archaeon]